jgi:hypothetical protein
MKAKKHKPIQQGRQILVLGLTRLYHKICDELDVPDYDRIKWYIVVSFDSDALAYTVNWEGKGDYIPADSEFIYDSIVDARHYIASEMSIVVKVALRNEELDSAVKRRFCNAYRKFDVV